MSPRDLVEEGIAAGALEWVPEDHDAAPPAGAYAPPVATFDGCHFCLAPSADARQEHRRLRDRLAAAIDFLDAVRRAPADDRPAGVMKDATEWLEAAARELVEGFEVIR